MTDVKLDISDTEIYQFIEKGSRGALRLSLQLCERKIWQQSKNIVTDIDSLTNETEMNDVHENFYADKNTFDFSEY